MNKPKFGTAGAGELFYSEGYKKSYEVPEFLKKMGLTAFEYQCGRGVNIGEASAGLLGEKAKENQIAMSLHAPYYISLAVTEKERWDKNANYFIKSAKAAKAMGAGRIVFHPGGIGKMSREEAYGLAAKTLKYVMEAVKAEGLDDIIFCPETMGKINQLGDLQEVLRFCTLYDNMLPCVDFGHMNSRTGGQVNSYGAFEQIFTEVANVLGEDKARIIHCHFSKIEYGQGGEKRHLTFVDEEYGPEFEPLMELIYKKGYTPTIICESAGTQAEDALAMSDAYRKWNGD